MRPVLPALFVPWFFVACVSGPAPARPPIDAPLLAPVSTSQCPGEDADVAAIRSSIARARAMAGVAPLRCDQAAVAATSHHCRYVTTNHELGHTETPGRPEFTGVSFQDRLSAQGFDGTPSAEIITSVNGADGIEGPAGMLNTVYHRAPILRPYNVSLGIASETACVTVDFGRGSESEQQGESEDQDVIWPPNGATHVPTNFVPRYESPNPLPSVTLAGSPVSLLTTGDLQEISATMTDADGANVDAVVITADTDPAKLVHAGDVHLLPRAPLSPNTKYVVHFHAVDASSGRVVDSTTTFTTGDE